SLIVRTTPVSALLPYSTLFRSPVDGAMIGDGPPAASRRSRALWARPTGHRLPGRPRSRARRVSGDRRSRGARAGGLQAGLHAHRDRKSTRLNSTHEWRSYAVVL